MQLLDPSIQSEVFQFIGNTITTAGLILPLLAIVIGIAVFKGIVKKSVNG